MGIGIEALHEAGEPPASVFDNVGGNLLHFGRGRAGTGVELYRGRWVGGCVVRKERGRKDGWIELL